MASRTTIPSGVGGTHLEGKLLSTVGPSPVGSDYLKSKVSITSPPMGGKKETDEDRCRTLLQHMATGDEQALTEFYRTFESRVYAFALSRFNDPHEATDILNEVMWEVWRGAGRFEGRASVLTWVFGIAHHKVVDRFRARGKYETEELNSEMPEEPIQTLDDVVNKKEEGEHLRQCLEELSDAHRQVVHLAFFEDLSQKEISEILGCPEGTVRAQMFYAKRALKRSFENRVTRY